MKDLGVALASGLLAPIRRWKLVLLLWLARLLPIILFFGLPAYDLASARLAHHPDSGRLLDPAADDSGFAFAWLSDTVRDDLGGSTGKVYWLVLLSWVLVSILAGGIIARLLRGPGESLWVECGRYAGRFLRLALTAAVLVYVADVAINALLAGAHEETAKLQHTQDYAWEKTWARGALFLTFLQIIGAIHGYARIEIVAHERRSAVVSFLRGFVTLIVRLPKLVVLEVVMLAAAGGGALVAWLLVSAARPAADATWLGVGVFLALAAAGSYLRTGVELGTLEARCRLLVEPGTVSRIETLAPPQPPPLGVVELPPPRD